MSRLSSSLHVGGTLSADTMTIPSSTVTNAMVKGDAAIARSKLSQDPLVKYMIPWNNFRVWDAFQTILPTTSASDDLGLSYGTLGSSGTSIRTSDLVGTSVTRYARFMFSIPAEYDAGETINLRAHAGMTAVAEVSATVDFSAYKHDNESGVGSDLVATAATSINSTTLASKDFDVTATGINPGDLLDVRMAVAVNDTGGSGACIAVVGGVWALLDIRG